MCLSRRPGGDPFEFPVCYGGNHKAVVNISSQPPTISATITQSTICPCLLALQITHRSTLGKVGGCFQDIFSKNRLQIIICALIFINNSLIIIHFYVPGWFSQQSTTVLKTASLQVSCQQTKSLHSIF